jgi:hypothetical protein
VHARVFSKIQSWESSGRIKSSNLLKDSADKLCLEELSKHRKFTLQVDKFREGTLSRFTDFIRRNGRSVFSEEDL